MSADDVSQQQWGGHSEEDKLKLVQVYYRQRLLWDDRLRDYGDDMKRLHAYMQMLTDLNAPGLVLADMVCLIRILRWEYFEERRKVYESQDFWGPEQHERSYTPREMWFPAMDQLMIESGWEHHWPPSHRPPLPSISCITSFINNHIATPGDRSTSTFMGREMRTNAISLMLRELSESRNRDGRANMARSNEEYEIPAGHGRNGQVCDYCRRVWPENLLRRDLVPFELHLHMHRKIMARIAEQQRIAEQAEQQDRAENDN